MTQHKTKAMVVIIERAVLEKVLLLHSHDLPMVGEVIEPIRRAIAAADAGAAPPQS